MVTDYLKQSAEREVPYETVELLYLLASCIDELDAQIGQMAELMKQIKGE